MSERTDLRSTVTSPSLTPTRSRSASSSAPFFEQRSDLTQAPAQLGARIVRAIPEQIAKPLAAMRLAGGDQVAKQGPGLLGCRKLERRIIAIRKLKLAEQADPEAGAGCPVFRLFPP